MRCDDIDSSQDRLHSGDAAQVGPTGGKGSGASSRASYESLIEKWIRPFFGKERLVQIGPYEVSRFMAWLRQEGLSPKTSRNIYTVLKQLLDVAVDNDLLKSSPIRPKLHRPKVTQKEKVVLTVPEAQAVLGALHGKWRAPVWTLALTGLRQGELLALRWQDLDLLEQRIQVQNSLWRRQLGTPKIGSSCRHVVMPDVLRDILVAHRSSSEYTDPEDFVFCRADGSPLDPYTLRRDGIYAAFEKAKVPIRERSSGCHAFRHLVGTIIHRQTGSLKLAQKQLGHSNILTTADIYTHVDEEEMRLVASILDRTLGETCGRSVVETAQRPETIQ